MTDAHAHAPDIAPRPWRDRATHKALENARRVRFVPHGLDLAGLVASVRPIDPDGYTEAMRAAAAEVVELEESGAKQPARDLARQRAEEIDAQYETEDALRDAHERARAERDAQRAADTDPAVLAAKVKQPDRIARRRW